MKIDRETFGKFFNGTPGKEWDDYASRLRNAAAGEVDERGYSLADEFDGVAEAVCTACVHACYPSNRGLTRTTPPWLLCRFLLRQ